MVSFLGFFRILNTKFSSTGSPRPGAKAGRSHKRGLRMEHLEDRSLLTTVTTLLDDNNGNINGTSLREAINAAVPDEVIDFATRKEKGTFSFLNVYVGP